MSANSYDRISQSITIVSRSNYMCAHLARIARIAQGFNTYTHAPFPGLYNYITSVIITILALLQFQNSTMPIILHNGTVLWSRNGTEKMFSSYTEHIFGLSRTTDQKPMLSWSQGWGMVERLGSAEWDLAPPPIGGATRWRHGWSVESDHGLFTWFINSLVRL